MRNYKSKQVVRQILGKASCNLTISKMIKGEIDNTRTSWIISPEKKNRIAYDIFVRSDLLN